MADEFLDKIRDALEAPIDYEGQQRADQIYTGMLAVVGILAFLVGYGTQSVYNCLYAGLAGTVFTFLVVVPPWPMFNRSPVQFLPSSRQGGINITVDGKKTS